MHLMGELRERARQLRRDDLIGRKATVREPF